MISFIHKKEKITSLSNGFLQEVSLTFFNKKILEFYIFKVK